MLWAEDVSFGLSPRAALLGVALLLAGCAGGRPLPPEAHRVAIGAVEARSADDFIIHHRMASILAEEVRRQLGERFLPGAGTTLSLTVTDVILPASFELRSKRGGHSSQGDEVGSRIALSKDNRVIARWPLLSNGPANVGYIDEIIPSDDRLQAAARIHAYWIVKKLNEGAS